MEFKSIGKVIFEGSEYSSEYLRTNIDAIKKNLSGNINNKACVAIMVERNQIMLCLIMALIESNITFLPIDLDLPENRIHYMLQNADIKDVIVSDNINFEFGDKYNTIKIDNLLENTESSYKDIPLDNFSNPVYYLFTSGSTGEPKAVVVNAKGFFNFLSSVPRFISFKPSERIACFTTISFDIFFLESVLALINGLTVVLANHEEQNNPKKMMELLVTQNISMLQSTPSRLKLIQMCDNSFESLKTIKTVMIGGEQFPLELLKKLQFNTGAKIYNMYGPTETTIWSTISDLTDKTSIDIGEPINETQIYLLKNRNTLAVEDEEGEICIAGVGLSDGYYKKQELTNKSFIELPVEPHCKVYCTGDLGKYENGKLICLGRIDNQIKINGYRIELEEIEENLKRIEEIIDTSVCFDLQNNLLVAFYISQAEINRDFILEKLKDFLPDYMIPSLFIKVDAFKYTASGKIDRKGMINEYCSKIHENNNIEKNDDVEKKVCSIIQREMHSNQIINKETTFESLSLNSLTYISIIVSLEDEFDIEFEEDYLLQDTITTVDDIIEHIKSVTLTENKM